MIDLDQLAQAIGFVAGFCFIFGGFAALADYLESQQQALRDRYDH